MKQRRPAAFVIFVALVGCAILSHCVVTAWMSQTPPSRTFKRPLHMAAMSEREKEIQRKIRQLKKNSSPSSANSYEEKIRQKLGARKSKMLGFNVNEQNLNELEDEDDEEYIAPHNVTSRQAQLGTLQREDEPADQSAVNRYKQPEEQKIGMKTTIIDPSLFDDGASEEGSSVVDMEDEELADLVAQKLMEKRAQEQRQKLERLKQKEEESLTETQMSMENSTTKLLTTGVGGSFVRNETAKEDLYQPKSGSWGAFPRPRDISKAYGGGRRVGPGYSNEQARLQSEEETRDRLRRYREKMGIEVQSEKDHAIEIEQALGIAALAMQRGIYSTAVSALEKVTRYCSTNSKVGGKVFLELAMAYEAAGRTEEAITVYSTLTKSRIEQIKINAKRLLYGIEAMKFMQEDLKMSEFSRKKARNTFIDTTGLADIASKFDDVYQTAYIDLEGGFYKRLTESVVRSNREARQILLRATEAGEVERMRVVQALRSISRRFDDALQAELDRKAAAVQEPVAVIDGKPILQRYLEDDSSPSVVTGVDEFVLADADQMKENLNGEWRLQLLADKRGDGVKFFNTSLSWQQVNMEKGQFSSVSPSGFMTVEQSGMLEFNDKRRILRRKSVEVSGNGVFLAGLFGATSAGAAGAVSLPQQVMTVDSVFLITRNVPSRKTANRDDEKDYFAVWRRVEPGTYSNRL